MVMITTLWVVLVDIPPRLPILDDEELLMNTLHVLEPFCNPSERTLKPYFIQLSTRPSAFGRFFIGLPSPCPVNEGLPGGETWTTKPLQRRMSKIAKPLLRETVGSRLLETSSPNRQLLPTSERSIATRYTPRAIIGSAKRRNHLRHQNCLDNCVYDFSILVSRLPSWSSV